ncbi:accessory Sec system glycosylation chaperone GtfB [Aerococcus urinae]|uniref:accessory Sec system glycosylation chaperone GtfB n=1 Tax=Aerococcus urinae TaxID=1376 RepID=UPI00254AD27F|nr:accessory Sec system glycosylation chaperone GtfB [Aerococcus urinae]MDK7716087.1 accessory Sec system glycosylation chaperone GtfB [Aerococcus urinae]
MIQLFDTYNEATRDFHQSMFRAGFNFPTVILNENGFLPRGTTSPYRFFMGEEEGQPLYFNEVSVPLNWEIKGTNTSASVWDYHHKRADIHYFTSGGQRLIKAVDWLNEAEQVMWTDCYNQYGRRYAQIIRHGQDAHMKIYFDTAGRDVIVDNYVTGNVILDWQGKKRVFHNRRDFYLFYLWNSELPLEQMIINSLATPFLISHSLPRDGKDILVWHEPLDLEIPGNMQLILTGQTPRCQKVIIPDQTTYQRALDLCQASHLPSESIEPLGYIYPILQEKEFTKEILILTNSDQIEQLDLLLDHLSDFQFRIGAITEMSDKLMNFNYYSNVQLYPNISMGLIQKLLKQACFYLDINHGNEIVDAVRAAFEFQCLNIAFKETLHKEAYIANEFIFSSDQAISMINTIKALGHSQKLWQQAISSQINQSNNVDEEKYQFLFSE